MKYREWLFRVILAASVLAGCVSLSSCVLWGEGSIVYDKARINVQFLSLFNQAAETELSGSSWKGDWIFRRARLKLIDSELRVSQPDILILQESLYKKSSMIESDRNILLAGALRGYSWFDIGIKEHPDSNEVETFAVVVDAPMELDHRRQASQYWQYPNSGVMTKFKVLVDRQPILVFNIALPDKGAEEVLEQIGGIIQSELYQERTCSNRVVVGLFTRIPEASEAYLRFKQKLGLVDTSLGRCEIEDLCYTSTTRNELFLRTNSHQTSKRTDRILISKNGLIHTSGVNFNTPSVENMDIASKYSFTKLWPTERFGWFAEITLAECQNVSF